MTTDSVRQEKGDLISRQRALAAIRMLYPSMPIVNVFGAFEKWKDKYKPYLECEDAIKIIPSVDSVKVVRCKDCPIGGECADSVDYSSECDEMFSHFLFNEPYDCGDEEEETESFADYVCRRFVEDIIGETPWYQEKENTTKTGEKPNGEIIVTIGEMEIKGLPKDVAMLIREVNANGGI